MRVRFAPSPTGQLHVGNARTALFNWLLAHGRDGTFLLRIEDTDAERSTRESEASILDDLRWLGLDWDEGPDVGGLHGPYRQSERLHLYASYANELIAGGQVYHCFCPPSRLDADRQADLASGRPPRYHGHCREIPRAQAQARIDAGERPVLRFRVPEHVELRFHDLVRGDVTFNTDVIGDFVIVRSDARPQYNFAVVIDDALMAVTHVIRGEDHISNTPRQLLLYQALGFTPPEFAHLSLVLGPDHTPLSKRHGATSVAEFRARGYLPEALVNYLALIGWSPRGSGRDADGEAELLPIDELARRFAIEDVGHSAGVFDPEKLGWMNRQYMKSAAPARLAAESLRYFVARDYILRRTDAGMEYLVSVLPMAAGSVDRLEEIPDRLRFLFQFDPAESLRRPEVAEVIAEPGARDVIAALADELATAERLTRDSFRAAAARVRERTGSKGRSLFHPIRVALTGDAGGPELDLAVPAIDRGAELPSSTGIAKITGCRERARLFADVLGLGTTSRADRSE
jgi:glutamyl-tRNA synthetase